MAAKGGVSVTPVASVFVIVTGDEVLDPGARTPKSTVVGETIRPPDPVPLNGTEIDPALVLVTTSDAALAPVSIGWNVT